MMSRLKLKKKRASKSKTSTKTSMTQNGDFFPQHSVLFTHLHTTHRNK